MKSTNQEIFKIGNTLNKTIFKSGKTNINIEFVYDDEGEILIKTYFFNKDNEVLAGFKFASYYTQTTNNINFDKFNKFLSEYQKISDK